MIDFTGPVNADEVRHAVAVAAGREAGSLLLTGCRVVNLFSGELTPGPVLLAGRLIAGVGEAFAGACATAVIDLGGALVAPGFIDGHVHLESALVEPKEYARAVVPRGVTGVVWDPHEWANVVGEVAFDAARQMSAGLPMDVFLTGSSCVAASPLETAGSTLTDAALNLLLDSPQVVGLAELMNFNGVVAGGHEELNKAWSAEAHGKPADGHAPTLSGRALQAYAAAGIRSDHECLTSAEAREKLRLGLQIMIREGSGARNLADLLPLVTKADRDRFCFVTDDRHPHDLLREGGVDFAVRKAVSLGLDLPTAVQLVTLNPARYFGLSRKGAVAPGYWADLAVLDPTTAAAKLVLKAGTVVARDGNLLVPLSGHTDPRLLDTVIAPQLSAERLRLKASGGPVRVIGLVPGQIVTRMLTLAPTVVAGAAVPDADRDLAKLAVIERHGKTGGIGVGLVQGLGLRRGALASTFAHDAHNIIVAGMNDDDMIAAVRAVARTGGGFAVVENGAVLRDLPLPVAGLDSGLPLQTVAAELDGLEAAARSLGVRIAAPFMTLSFLALSVIPELKLTDQGLVDAAAGRIVPFEVSADIAANT